MRRVCAVAALVGLVALGGCATARKTAWHPTVVATVSPSPTPPPAAITAPADGASDVLTAAEVMLSGATADTAVTLTDATGATVPGALRPDRSAWVPATELKYG